MFLSTKTILLCCAISGTNGFGVQAPVKSRFGVVSVRVFWMGEFSNLGYFFSHTACIPSLF
jgi:hypothetical protein